MRAGFAKDGGEESKGVVAVEDSRIDIQLRERVPDSLFSHIFGKLAQGRRSVETLSGQFQGRITLCSIAVFSLCGSSSSRVVQGLRQTLCRSGSLSRGLWAGHEDSRSDGAVAWYTIPRTWLLEPRTISTTRSSLVALKTMSARCFRHILVRWARP